MFVSLFKDIRIHICIFRKMPTVCCVLRCKGNRPTGPKVSVHRFPRDEEKRLLWIAATKRKDFVPHHYSRVCELHFEEDDFIREARGFDERTGKTIVVPLKVKRLKTDAIPSIFPRECPAEKSGARKEDANSKAIQKSLLQNQQYEVSRSFGSLKEVHSEIDTRTELQNVTEPFIAIKQESVESTEELPSSFLIGTSSFPENMLPVACLDSTNLDTTSVTIKPQRRKKINIVKPNAGDSCPRTTKAESFLLAKSPRLSKRSKMSQNATESYIAIKLEPEESTNELSLSFTGSSTFSSSSPLFISSSSFPEASVANPDLTNVDKTLVTIKPKRKKKIKIVKSDAQSKLHRLSKLSTSSKRSKMSQNVIKPSFASKQESIESTKESPSLVIDKVLSLKELIPTTSCSSFSCSSSSFPENMLPVANTGSINVSAALVAIKPEAIKEEIVESTEESSPLVIQNILYPENLVPSSSSLLPPSNMVPSSSSLLPPSNSSSIFNSTFSLPGKAFPGANPDLTNEDETSFLIKPKRKKKINNVKPDDNDFTPSVTQAKLQPLAKPSMLSNGMSKATTPSRTKKSSGRSISPTEDAQNSARDIFLPLLNGSENIPLSGFKTNENPGDLFDVLASFIAEKLREMNWNNCAVALRSIMDIFFKAGQVHKSSNDDDEEEDACNSTPNATEAKRHRLAKSSVSSRRSKMSQNVSEPFITIKQEPVESTDEPPTLVIDNVLSVKELTPSNGCSSSFPEHALPDANTNLINADETSVTNKHKGKIRFVKPDASNFTPGAKQTKLHFLTKLPMLSKKISGTKKSSDRRSISPTEDTQNATRELFLSLMNGSEKNSLSGSKTNEKPGDLFDVFASFIAEKLREMNWENCAFALRSILDIVFKPGQVQVSSEEEDSDIYSSDIGLNSLLDQE